MNVCSNLIYKHLKCGVMMKRTPIVFLGVDVPMLWEHIQFEQNKTKMTIEMWCDAIWVRNHKTCQFLFIISVNYGRIELFCYFLFMHYSSESYTPLSERIIFSIQFMPFHFIFLFASEVIFNQWSSSISFLHLDWTQYSQMIQSMMLTSLSITSLLAKHIFFCQ